MKNKKVLAFFLLLTFPSVSAQAYWVWSPEQGKFVNAEGVSQDAAQDDFDYAMKFYREKNLKEAADRFEEILKKYPQSRVAPEAQYRLGLALEEQGDYLKAFKAYKRLVESYPQSERFNEVIEREFRVGNIFLSGQKAKFAGFEILASLPKAVDVFEHIVKHAPYSDYGPKAQFQLGIALKRWKKYGQAVDAFQAVIDQYPNSDLVSQARYELAESSFLRSASNVRDQRALDDASKQVNKFLNQHPDANTSEKAAKIRHEIDEKNAEKNYRIGLYYEKDNYVESALIYYQDVAARYPDTQWGQKANQKLNALKDPAKYLNQKKDELAEQEKALETKLQALEKGGDPVERDSTKRSLERIQKHRKSLEKDKKESIARRKDDLKRRERELKQKFKNLDQKRKLQKKNKSEDLQRAIDRWQASLMEEKDQLSQERQQLEGWREDLGMKDGVDMSFLPFVGEPISEVQKVQQIEAKKFFKLSQEKQSLLEEKETLYKHHSEVSSLLQAKPLSAPADLSEASRRLEGIEGESSRLERELREKTDLYEKKYGKSALGTLAGGITKSLDILNPFDGNETKNEQELLERQMHLKEQIAAQQALVDTLAQAFDSQIALEEQKRLMAGLKDGDQKDPRQLRKAVRELERKIRGGYEDIEARHKHKKKLLDELDESLKQRENENGFVSAVNTATAPARLVKAFFVGLPNRDEELTKSAENVEGGTNAARIKQLEEEIKTESLIIEAKSREITNQRKELEILKAQAAFSGGHKFRSVFIDIPYLFYNEAMDSARRIVPKKNREEMLISRLNQETEKLESLKKSLSELTKQIDNLDPAAVAAASQKVSETQEPSESQEQMRREIEALSAKLQTSVKASEQGKTAASGSAQTPASLQRHLTPKQSKKLQKELREIEESLKDLIAKESDLEKEETEILEKRAHHIDKTMKKVHSKAVSQDLLTEKERIEERLSQLESRRDFLTQEIKRFDPVADASNPRS